MAAAVAAADVAAVPAVAAVAAADVPAMAAADVPPVAADMPTGGAPEATPTPGARSPAIATDSRSALWACFEAHLSPLEALPRPGASASLDAAVAALALTRSQTQRQFDRWRRSRRSDDERAHEHAASLAAHRRRAYGADDTLHNRLRSIALDSRFVAEAAARFAHWPVVANLRSGAWYCAAPAATAYFKSADGHCNEWALSLRRLNWHLLDLAAAHGGLLLVDATRRGRALPDAFAKTVPIWCACVNRAARRHCPKWDSALHAAPGVDPAEIVAIEDRLDGFVSRLLDCVAGTATMGSALEGLRKPLRPVWVTHGQSLDDIFGGADTADLPYYPLVCVSASAPVDVERREGYTYLQGAADDEEAWAGKLTAALLWAHSDRIFGADAGECPAAVAAVLTETAAAGEPAIVGGAAPYDWIVQDCLAVGGRRAGRPPDCWANFEAVINVTLDEYAEMPPREEGRYYLQCAVAEGKRDRRGLEAHLPAAIRFAAAHLRHGRRVLVHCAQGRDRSVAVAAAVLAALFSSDEELRAAAYLERLATLDDAALKDAVLLGERTKDVVTHCLAAVALARPTAAPSRHTVKKLHRFFSEAAAA